MLTLYFTCFLGPFCLLIAMVKTLVYAGVSLVLTNLSPCFS